MSNLSSSAQASSYYAKDNYYSQEEARDASEWVGKGAEALGLVGSVQAEDFVRVLNGEVAGQTLGRTVRDEQGESVREHRPGFDITLSAPKSVSLLAEVEGRSDVREAHRQAVGAVFEYVEKNLAGTRLSMGGETEFVTTGNVVAAMFHHNTSRDLDPQTHTHIVLANATQLPDGTWRSVSNEAIYENQKLLGRIYDSELAANLRDLGYKLDDLGNGRFEIAGFSKEQLEHFSQRTQAIDERLASFGLTRETATAAQREAAALHTRSSKGEVVPEELLAQWQARAVAQGMDFSRIEADRQREPTIPQSPASGLERADRAIDFAIRSLTERDTVVERREVLSTALSHASLESEWGGVRLPQLETALQKREQADVIAVDPKRLTTQDALQSERELIGWAIEGREKFSPIMSAETAEQALKKIETARSGNGETWRFTVGQFDAALTALSHRDQYLMVQGYAGSGKTTMLDAVRSLAEEQGVVVRGMAPSAEAARVMQQESGIESLTVARFLIDEKKGIAANGKESITVTGAIDMAGREIRSIDVKIPKAPAARNELWVVDEAGLLTQRQARDLTLAAKEVGARVLYVGDQRQLQGVDAGKPFEMLQAAGIRTVQMPEMNRQRVEDLREAALFAAKMQNAKSFDVLMNRVVEVPSKELVERVARDIINKAPDERERHLVIAPRNETRRAINEAVRSGLQGKGEISSQSERADVLVARDMTSAERQHASYYMEGLVVRFNRDYKSMGISRGDYGEVRSVDKESGTVTVKMQTGRELNWSPAKHTQVEVYTQESRQLAAGDLIRFTRNAGKDAEVNNGTPGRVIDVTKDRAIVATDKGNVELNLKDRGHQHIEYGYSMTVFGSQGKTAEGTAFVISKESGRAAAERAYYVGVTRGRNDLVIYTDDREKAGELILKAVDKSSAVEFLGSGASARDSEPEKPAARHVERER